MPHTDNDLCEFLNWDTDFFGYRIARARPHVLAEQHFLEIDEWCEHNDIQCLYLLADSLSGETIRLAEDHDYRQTDVRIVYNIRAKLTDTSTHSLPNDMLIDTATEADIPQLLMIVDNAYRLSRFYFDPKFDEVRCNQLYQTWVVKSVNRILADQVFVIRHLEKVLAFVTCSLDRPNRTGTIGLVGVADFARGHKLGRILVNRAISFFSEQEIELVEVVTQARNIAANRLYQECGFRTSNVYLWYHKWYYNASELD